MLRKPLVIDIYSEPTRSVYDHSGKDPLKAKFQEYTFFHIDSITKLDYEDGIERCAIISSGKIYICRDSYQLLQSFIMDCTMYGA